MKRLIESVKNYIPGCEQEEKDRANFLEWLKTGEKVLSRDSETVHFTASAWIVSPDRSKVLMAYHNLYNSWAWLGGHADGEADLLNVALKEVREESGLTEVKVLTEDVFSLETLCVLGHEKRGEYVSSHLHLNVTYLVEADPAAVLRIKEDENSAIGWVPVEEIPLRSSEEWFVERIYSKLCEKVKKGNW